MTDFVTRLLISSHIVLISSQKFTKWFYDDIFATIENEYINT